MTRCLGADSGFMILHAKIDVSWPVVGRTDDELSADVHTF
jgi:hypothetical protein